MKKILSTVVIASVFLFACSNSDQTSDTQTEATPGMTTESTTPVSPDAAVQVPASENNGAMSTMSTQGSPAPTSAPPPTTQQTSTATGMNPPHGEPGHRCDIAVGAPLNSAPATPASGTPPSPSVVTSPNLNSPSISTPQVISAPAPSMSGSPTTPATSAPAPTTSTAPGMNPPHGQPGHDCAVPVGSPLPAKK